MPTPKFDAPDYIGINGVGRHQLLHPHFEAWQRYFTTEYQAPRDRIAVFLPCAAIKPYPASPIHKIINRYLEPYQQCIHRIVISNAGIIPYEFSHEYPFDSYDWNPAYETPEIINEYIKVTHRRLTSYLSRHPYKGYVSYLRWDSASYRALKCSMDNLNLPLHAVKVKGRLPRKDPDLLLTLPGNLGGLGCILGRLTGAKPLNTRGAKYDNKGGDTL